jgi:hypothetical protein
MINLGAVIVCECKNQLDRVEGKLDDVLTFINDLEDMMAAVASNPMLKSFLPKF